MKTSKKYNVHLKDTIAVFTKRLFYLLFDEQPKDELKFLENTFLEIAKKLFIEKEQFVWKTFIDQFSDIRKKLDFDAIAIEKNDQKN